MVFLDKFAYKSRGKLQSKSFSFLEKKALIGFSGLCFGKKFAKKGL
jgi:hypothetical protein